MNIKEIECKSLMTKSKLPDADYVINPYIGCNHGCVYCYARFMCRFSGHSGEEWGGFMDIKRGGRLSGNFDGKTILFGSVTDPYNPLENKYRVTRNALERLLELKSEATIEILTKSSLVTRDIDLFKKIQNLCVGISVSSCDENFTRLVETHVASTKQRIATVKELHNAGISVYLFVSPIFPYLSDWRALADAVHGYVDKVCFENLNLRTGYRAAVLEIIEKHYPEIYAVFAEIYSDKLRFREYWENEAVKIRAYMGDKSYKLYFFHEEMKKM